MTTVPSQKFPAGILLLLYTMSGLVSLAYEVLWVRMLSLQFGVSIFGVVVTVAAFMAGLGAGSLLGIRVKQNITRPLMAFALLEASVAMLALGMPWLLQQWDAAIPAMGSVFSLPVWYVMQLCFIGLLLFVPAVLMGVAFPVILAAIKDTRISLSYLYGLNAIGASAGALLPLLLLPALGWLDSMRVVAYTGLMVALAAYVLSLKSSVGTATERATIEFLPDRKSLIIYAGIGAAALMLEIGWTRLFGMVLLRTEYVLAIILAVFLSGIGLGSVLARHLHQRTWFTVLPVLASLFAIGSLWLIPHLSAWSEFTGEKPYLTVLLWQGGLLALVTFPVTFVLGAWLPMLTKRYGDNGQSAALLYGYNSVGAAVGALIAGFVLTPGIGTSATLVMASILLLVFGLTWAHSAKGWLMLPVLSLMAYPVMSMPSVEDLLPGAYSNTRDVYYHEDAITITHVVERKDGQRLLLADLQRMDASSDPAAVEIQKNQARLPLLLHPEPKSVLFLGLGTGISAAGSMAFPGLDRTAVELSQGAIDAARHWFAEVNDNVADRLKIIRDDARHFLMTDQSRYDVVVGDLFHPDLVGRSALLTVQQFRRVKERLTEDGIFAQWLALNQFDRESLKIVLRSFQKVFPNAVIFSDAFRLVLVGANDFNGAPALLGNLNRLPDSRQTMATGGEGAWTWLGRYWGRLALPQGRIQQEWAPVIEFSLPHARYDGGLDLRELLAFLLQQRPPLEQAARELQVMESDFAAFERAYAATELAYRSWLALLIEQDREGQRILKLAYQANPKDRWIGFAVADGALASLDAGAINGVDTRKVLESVIRIRPDHADALYRLWRLEEASDNPDKAREYRDRLAKISPYDNRLR